MKRTDAKQDKQRHLFNITVTNFSGFSIGSNSSAYVTKGVGSSGDSTYPITTSTPISTPISTPALVPITSTTAIQESTPTSSYTEVKTTSTSSSIGSKIVSKISVLLGFILPASENDLENCGGCNLWGINHGLWIVCWYWWVLIFAILLQIIVYLALKLHKKACCLFYDAELIPPVSLAIKIRDSKDPLSGFIREHFSEETLQLLNGLDDSTPPSISIRKILIDELNRLLQNDRLYNEQRFTNITLEDETRRLIAQNPEGNELISLNRLLLKDAYPDEIVNMHKEFDKISKLIYWIPVVIILLIPLGGFIGLLTSPINWVTGIVAEIIYILYFRKSNINIGLRL